VLALLQAWHAVLDVAAGAVQQRAQDVKVLAMVVDPAQQATMSADTRLI
jgi:hypothetical protein